MKKRTHISKYLLQVYFRLAELGGRTKYRNLYGDISKASWVSSLVENYKRKKLLKIKPALPPETNHDVRVFILGIGLDISERTGTLDKYSEVLSDICKIKGISWASIVSGRYDIIAEYVSLSHSWNNEHQIAMSLSNIIGLKKLNTFPVAESSKKYFFIPKTLISDFERNNIAVYDDKKLISLSKTDRKIFSALNEDGRKPFSKITEETKLDRNTITKYYKSMEKTNRLAIVPLLNFSILPNLVSGIVAISMGTVNKKCKNINSGEKPSYSTLLRKISKLDQILWVSAVLGQYEILAEIISFSGTSGIFDFTRQKLLKIPNILSCETFLLIESKNKWINLSNSVEKIIDQDNLKVLFEYEPGTREPAPILE